MLSWMQSLKPEEISKWRNYVMQDIESGSEMFITKVHQKFKLNEFEKSF